MNQTQVQDTLDVEAYPKPGKPNPIVDLFVYDVAAKKTTQDRRARRQAVRQRRVGHYVYNVDWSPDGKDLLLNRTNRRQNILEFAACSPETGKCRAIVHEEWPTGWIENRPEMRFLKDGKRFIWESERNGFKNFYLYDLTGKLLAPLTSQTALEADNIVLVDEARGFLFYTARDGDNYMKLQLHRVGSTARTTSASPIRRSPTPSARRPTASTSSTSRRRTTAAGHAASSTATARWSPSSRRATCRSSTRSA